MKNKKFIQPYTNSLQILCLSFQFAHSLVGIQFFDFIYEKFMPWIHKFHSAISPPPSTLLNNPCICRTFCAAVAAGKVRRNRMLRTSELNWTCNNILWNVFRFSAPQLTPIERINFEIPLRDKFFISRKKWQQQDIWTVASERHRETIKMLLWAYFWLFFTVCLPRMSTRDWLGDGGEMRTNPQWANKCHRKKQANRLIFVLNEVRSDFSHFPETR